MTKITNLAYIQPRRSIEDLPVDPTQANRYKEQAGTSEEFQDPLERLIKKISRLGAMLECSEEDAERILFNRI